MSMQQMLLIGLAMLWLINAGELGQSQEILIMDEKLATLAHSDTANPSFQDVGIVEEHIERSIVFPLMYLAVNHSFTLLQHETSLNCSMVPPKVFEDNILGEPLTSLPSLAIVGVLSMPLNAHRRALIRSSPWAWNDKETDIKCLFMIPRPLTTSSISLLEEEADRFGDVVMLDVNEHTDDTLIIQALLHFFSLHSQAASCPFVVRSDDATFLALDIMGLILEKLPTERSVSRCGLSFPFSVSLI